MRKATVTLSLTAAVLAGCSGDLTIKSDLGEKVIIKKSAVDAWTYDKTSAERQLKGHSKSSYWQEQFDRCLARGAARSTCLEFFGGLLETEKQSIEGFKGIISQNLKFGMVKYRPISVDLNGKKTAPSDYISIVCIPKTFGKEQATFALQAAESLGYKPPIAADTDPEYEIRLKVCQKFGGS